MRTRAHTLTPEAVEIANDFASRLRAREFDSQELAETALTEAISDYADRNLSTDDAIRILRESDNPCIGWYELGKGVADWGTPSSPAGTFPFESFAASVLAYDTKRALTDMGHDLSKMSPLKTETNTPEMEEQIRLVFKASDLYEEGGTVNLAFEHGQWWVTYLAPVGADDDEPHTYSVVDAEGGSSIDGFDFEEV
jgi:hypothetical protein